MSAHKTIGVIGLGSAGMRHAKNLLAMGHRVWGYDPNSSRLVLLQQLGGKPVAQLWGCERTFDGIVIASPTKNHLENIWAITGRTVKVDATPIFVEKPIHDNVDGYLVAQHTIMVGNNLRFHACVKKAKEWLNAGLIGKPLWASFCVAQHNTKYTDPVVLNWGAHEFDLALYLLGPATVTAAAGNDQIMDVCLLHEYGVPSTVHCDYVTKPERRAFFIAGEAGVISVNLAGRDAIRFDPEGGFANVAEIFCGSDSFDENYKDEMQAFIDLIDGKPVPHAATGQDGLHALGLILEAQRMAGSK